MTRLGVVVVVLGALFAGSAFSLLKMRDPDDLGDGGAPDAAAVREVPPRTASAASRNPGTPPPAAPEPPPASTPTRRAAARSAEPDLETAPPATAATLRVVSDVAGAQVFLNREFIGAAPITRGDLAPGSYQLNVSAPGFDNHVETLELAPGDGEVSIRFREVRLSASLAVIHTHRFGSCKGTLAATPAGLRYDTSDRDDAFEAALIDLETFQIDYSNKNLTVQPRRGKRYDFTDPEGNADRLFVFHRDVERARERLRKGAGQ